MIEYGRVLQYDKEARVGTIRNERTGEITYTVDPFSKLGIELMRIGKYVQFIRREQASGMPLAANIEEVYS